MIRNALYKYVSLSVPLSCKVPDRPSTSVDSALVFCISCEQINVVKVRKTFNFIDVGHLCIIVC